MSLLLPSGDPSWSYSGDVFLVDGGAWCLVSTFDFLFSVSSQNFHLEWLSHVGLEAVFEDAYHLPPHPQSLCLLFYAIPVPSFAWMLEHSQGWASLLFPVSSCTSMYHSLMSLVFQGPASLLLSVVAELWDTTSLGPTLL